MSINDFIEDLDKTNIKSYFNDPELLKKSLIELDNVIGMNRIKLQILKQIKTFISSKAKGIYKESDRKHCLLCGPPGCGKTTVGKILCKIWIAIGFIGKNKRSNKKALTFNKAQDELIRNQKEEIKDNRDKVRHALNAINNATRIKVISKRSISNLIRIKQKVPDPLLDTIITDVSSCINIIEESSGVISKLMQKKTNMDMKGYGIETDDNMADTKEEPDLPFYVYNRNDVVSRYVGDTTHRCTKAMTEALDGVAYFDEAYNLCTDTNGFGDSYGKVALTTINQFMDEHADKLIVVFAGYKEDIYNNLFRAQKGLESRFTNKFEIENYSAFELTKIFIQRLHAGEWQLDETPELHKIIKDNVDLFEFQGRDMDTLALYTKNIVSEKLYEKIISGKQIPTKITDLDIIKQAVEIFKQNMLSKVKKPESEIERMVNLLRT